MKLINLKSLDFRFSEDQLNNLTETQLAKAAVGNVTLNTEYIYAVQTPTDFMRQEYIKQVNTMHAKISSVLKIIQPATFVYVGGLSPSSGDVIVSPASKSEILKLLNKE